MPIVRTILLLLLMNITLSIFAQEDTHSKKEIEEVLIELDSAIAQRKHYQTLRHMRADSMEQIVNSCHVDDYVDKCKELYRALSYYDGRQALNALQRIQNTKTM